MLGHPRRGFSKPGPENDQKRQYQPSGKIREDGGALPESEAALCSFVSPLNNGKRNEMILEPVFLILILRTCHETKKNIKRC